MIRTVFLLILISGLAPTSGFCTEGMIDLAGRMEMAYDRDRQWTLRDITNTFSNIFQPVPRQGSSINLGYGNGAYWFRFSIDKSGQDSGGWFLHTGFSWFEHIDLYLLDRMGQLITNLMAGKDLPMSRWNVRHREVSFALGKTAEGFVYIRALASPLHFTPRLMEQEAFHQSVSMESFIFGLVYGFLIFLIIMAALLLAAYREKSVIFFLVFVFFSLFMYFTLSGMGYQMLWPENTWWHKASTDVLPGITFFFYTLFSVTMLRLDLKKPFLYIISIFPGITALFITAGGLLGRKDLVLPVIAFQMLYTPFIFLIVSFVMWIGKKSRESFYYLVSFTPLMISVIMFGLRDAGFIPHGILTEVAPVAGMSVQIVFVYLAIKARLDEEKERRIRVEIESREAIEERDARFRETADILPVGICELDSRMRVLYINPKGAELMNISRSVEEWDITAFFRPEDRSKVISACADLLENRHESAQFESWTAGGINKHCLSVYAAPTRHKRTAGGIRLALMDITRIKESEQELQEWNSRLENRVTEELEKNRQKDTLIYKQARMAGMGELIRNISHHWRNPLNSVGLTVQNIDELVRTGEINTETLNHKVKKIMGVLEMLSHSIDGFRRIYAVEESLAGFSVEEALEAAVDIIMPSFSEERIKINRHVSAGLQAFNYRSALIETLLSLLQNSRQALNFHPAGAPGIMINIGRLEKPGGGIDCQITVWDNGGGFPDKDLDRVMDPFFSTYENRVGLGLYMARMNVEDLMKVRLSCTNQVRHGVKGALVTITFPMRLDAVSR